MKRRTSRYINAQSWRFHPMIHNEDGSSYSQDLNSLKTLSVHQNSDPWYLGTACFMVSEGRSLRAVMISEPDYHDPRCWRACMIVSLDPWGSYSTWSCSQQHSRQRQSLWWYSRLLSSGLSRVVVAATGNQLRQKAYQRIHGLISRPNFKFQIPEISLNFDAEWEHPVNTTSSNDNGVPKIMSPMSRSRL